MTDAELRDRLDFHGLARRYGSWPAAGHLPPIVVGSPERYFPRVGDDVLQAALNAAVVSGRAELDRGVPRASYRGDGVVAVGEEWWCVQSTTAHENVNHDFVAGWVSGYRVRPVEPARLARLARSQLEAGDLQTAMVCLYFAGDALEPFDRIESSAATDDLLDKMQRLRLWDAPVVSVAIDRDHPYLARVVVSARQVTTDRSIPVFSDGDQAAFGAVPRAGIAQLVGAHLSLPSPGGPLPPD